MAYDNIISRGDVSALIPEDVSERFLTGTTEESAALTLFTTVPMSRAQQRMPVLSAYPVAYFVNGDTGLKQTTEMAWTNKYINVEELAVIVPIPENVIADLDFDIEAAIRPRLEEAIGRALDDAVFFGTNKPASWPTAIVPGAIAAGNTYARGTNAAAAGGIAEDFNQLFSVVEADGYDVNGIVAVRSLRGRLRGARDANGVRLGNVGPGEVEGITVTYPMRGMWPTGLSAAEAIAGDFDNGIIGLRQDVTFKALDQAVIQDNTGAIIYNLAQQDMVAIRVTFRVGFQIANLLNRDNATEATRYPWGVLLSPAA